MPFSGGAAVPSQHNDQFIVITHEDLFRVVEPVVQRRIELEIAPLLRFYRDRGQRIGRVGLYPFAVPFMNPGLAGGRLARI